MVSKRKVDAVIEERMQNLFFEAITHLKKKDQVAQFLQEFLTPTEKIMFSKRLSIALLLLKDYQYQSISSILKVSSATIERINRWIKHEGKYFKSIVNQILQKEKDEEAWHNFWQAVESSTLTLSRGNWSARRKKIYEKDREFKKERPF